MGQSDRHRGLYRKFDVRRTDGSSEPGGEPEDWSPPGWMKVGTIFIRIIT